MRKTEKPKIKETRTCPPARTPEERESQMIALAVDLAEKQLMEGTASAQVITHYLKLGSIREKYETQKLIEENELLKAKTESIKSARRTEEMYARAIQAMKSYADLEDGTLLEDLDEDKDIF